MCWNTRIIQLHKCLGIFQGNESYTAIDSVTDIWTLVLNDIRVEEKKFRKRLKMSVYIL